MPARFCLQDKLEKIQLLMSYIVPVKLKLSANPPFALCSNIRCKLQPIGLFNLPASSNDIITPLSLLLFSIPFLKTSLCTHLTPLLVKTEIKQAYCVFSTFFFHMPYFTPTMGWNRYMKIF